MTKTKVMDYHSKKKPKMREPSRAFDAKFKRIARFNNPKVKPEKCMLFLRLQIILILTK